jgi:CHAT domain-containing protein/Tfp pilus assembly protein PilF
MHYIGLLFTCWMIGLLPAFGQKNAKVDTIAAFRAFQRADELIRLAKYDSAIVYSTQAKDGYKAYALNLPDNKKSIHARNKAWERYFLACNATGWCLKEKYELDSSLQLLLQTKADCRRQLLGDSAYLMVMHKIANSIGAVYDLKGQYKQAIEHYQQALAMSQQVYGENHHRVGLILLNIGSFYRNQSDYEKALDYFRHGEKILKLALGDQHPDVAMSYHNAAAVYRSQGQYNRALEYLQQALAIRKKAFSEQHPDVANGYNNIANVYAAQGLHDKALEYFKQALAIKIQTTSESHPDLARIYSNIASMYFVQRQYDKALKFHLHALAIRKQAFGDQHPFVALSLNSIGNVYFEKDQYTLAMDYLQQALSIQQQVFGEDHPDVTMSLANIGAVYSIQKRYTPAVEQYNKALRACLPAYNAKGYQTLYSKNTAALNLTLNNLLIALGLRDSTGDDTLALATVRFADQLIDSLRKAYTYDNDKLEIGTSAHRLYQAAIDVAKWNKLDEECFYYSEKNKAAVLTQSLNEATALKLGGIPDSLLMRDKELRTRVAFYTKASIDEELKCPYCDSAKLHIFKQELFNNQQQHTLLKSKLERDFSRFFALKYKDAQISVQKIQQGFLHENPNSAILEYLMGDTVIYAFCITKDKYTFHRQKLDTTRFKKTNALQLEVKKLARALADVNLHQDYTTFISQPANALYDYLIKPFEQQIQGKDLIIIPDGELNKIPFEMLIKHNQDLNGVKTWQNLSYLIKQHNISYHYSANLLIEDWQKNKSQPVKSSGFVAFAPVFNDSATGKIVSNENTIEQSYLAYASRSDSVSRAFMHDGKFISPLPGTEREVKAIYELFNQKSQPAKYYLNDQANESTVKSINLKPYKYLHFATHGLTDEDRPTNSCLILAQKQDSTSDNLLTSSEMYGLELDAELVVLSACQTGKGTFKAGEGIIGLTRGLLYAGARNLMVSQWNVNDASTAELMTKFYSKILTGQSNRQALREAKLELLNSKFACPHYWSAFVLVGR